MSDRRPAVVALVPTLLVLLWQLIAVQVQYAGNWRGLFYTGDVMPIPANLHAAETPKHRNSAGWDGQYYRYIAHDPFLSKGYVSGIDAPRLRYRRILLPLMAWTLAAGQERWIDATYPAAVLFFVWLGCMWSTGIAQTAGRSSWWGCLFPLLPAAVVSIDRMAVDVALAAFCAGFVYLIRREAPPWQIAMLLAAACLARDTGLLLAGGYVLWLLTERRWRPAVVAALTPLPTLAWYAFVNMHTAPYVNDGTLAAPLSGLVHRLVNPMPYPGVAPLATTVLRAADLLAALSVALSFLMVAGKLWVVRPFDPRTVTAGLFVLLGMFVWRPGDWLEAYDYGRILSPILFFLAVDALERGRVVLAAPLLGVLPRFALQVAGMFVAALRDGPVLPG